MIRSSQFLLPDVKTFLESRLVPECVDAFPLERIADIAAWTGQPSPNVYAPVLLALHSVNASSAFSDACAEAIVATDAWRSLLAALLNNAQIGSHVIATACKVLHSRGAAHPLASLRDTPLRATRICDAIDDGRQLRVASSAWSPLGDGKCWLLGLADPVEQIAEATATLDGDHIVLDPSPADWLERSRLACPAFLAIAP